MANRYWVGGTATWDGTAGSKWSLTSGGAGGQAVPTSSDTVFFDAASGANTVTIGLGTAICSALTMTGFTGTLAFGTNSITCAGTGAIYTGATTFSATGTPLILCTNSSATARTITATTTTEANSVSFNISAGTGTINFVGGSYCKSVNFTGFTGTWTTAAAITFYGSLTLVSGMTYTAGAGTFSFANTSGTAVITSAGKTLNPVIQNGVGGTVALSGALTTSTYTLTNGSLDLTNAGAGNYTLTCTTLFSSSNTNTRSIAFGTGQITCTGSGTVFSVSGTNLTYTGTPTVNISNNSATATTITATNFTETNAFNFNVTTGTYALTVTTASFFKSLNFTGFTGTWSPSTATTTFYGSLTLVSGMTFTAGTGLFTFANTSGTAIITPAGKTLNPITQNGVGGAVALNGALTTSTYTLTNGALDLTNSGAGNYTLTCTTLFSSSNSNTRSIAFGTGQITCTGSGTIFNTSTGTGLTYTGTPTVNISNNSATATTVNQPSIAAGGSIANAFNYNFTTGTYALTITAGAVINNINFTGFTGSWSPSTGGFNLYGNLTFSFGMTFTAGSTWTFAATSGTQIITSAGQTLGSLIQSAGGNVAINGNLTIDPARTYTLTTGTLDLTNGGAGNYILSTGIFSSNNSNTRSVAFGTGNITLTGNAATIWTTATATGFSYTGTPTVNCTYSGSTGTRTITGPTTEANAVSFNISNGADIVALSSFAAKNVNFTGFSGTMSNTNKTIYGNLIISSSMTCTSGTNTITFAATSGTQQITTNGNTTIDFPITQNSPGATLQLQDNLTIGATRTFTLTAGTLDLNSNKVLSVGQFSSSNSNTRSILFGTGNITATGNNLSALFIAVADNFTYTGTPTVNCTYSGSVGTRAIQFGTTSGGTESNCLNFNVSSGSDIVGIGGFSTSAYGTINFTGFTGSLNSAANTRNIYRNVIFSSGMTITSSNFGFDFKATLGTQQITTNGNATIDFPINFSGTATYAFQDALTMGSTRALTFSSGTLQFKAGTTNTVGSFVTIGTTLKFLTSSTPGTQAIISDPSGTNAVTYLSIQDSNATGGATFNAFLTDNNVNAGNNTGWNFSASTGNYFLLF
jgi:hypothetical protein